MNRYKDYFLTDNPFPATPTLDPDHDDIRINGRIYNRDIMKEEIQSFDNKIRRRPPIIYIENSVFVRGVGKSALTAQKWRELREKPNITSIYLRSQKGFSPATLATEIIRRWHQDSNLWTTVLRLLGACVEAGATSAITKEGILAFSEAVPKLPLQRISLQNFLVFNPSQLIGELARFVWELSNGSMHLDLANVLFRSYLTDPRTFPAEYPKALRKHNWDSIDMLRSVYRLLKLGGYEFHYLFLDQFEDVVQGLAGKRLLEFNTQMRRLIEASIDRATLIVTLHPGATNTLSSDEGGDITSIAPLDQRHVVDVRKLTVESARPLALTYLGEFRLAEESSPDLLYPFSEKAIEEIFRVVDGNIRAYLQALNYAIEEGVDTGSPAIDGDFVVAHHEEITGRIHPEDIQL